MGITEKQSEEEDFLCRPCQVVDTGAPLPLTIDTLIPVTKGNPAIPKRVPKHARIPSPKPLTDALDGIVAKRHDESRIVLGEFLSVILRHSETAKTNWQKTEI